MGNKNKERGENIQSEDNFESEEKHVHGPDCNHGHHHHALKPIVRSGEKVGRNDPCLCGSQKKFKKCCGK